MKQSMSNHELALCQWQVHKINIGEGYFIKKITVNHNTKKHGDWYIQPELFVQENVKNCFLQVA